MKADQLHNRQRSSTKNTGKKSIRQRLKSYMEEVSVDVFGLEKKVPKNILNYLSETSSRHKIPVEQIMIRITKKESGLRVFLHHNSKLLDEVLPKEFVLVFTGPQLAEIPNVQRSVIEQISQYLDDFAQEKKMEVGQLSVLISANQSAINIEAYMGQQYAGEITIKELIKYFKA